MNAPREFDGLESFILHLASLEATAHRSHRRGLELALKLIEQDAKDQIGHYQPQVGEFPAWAPLAASTEEEKARMGAPANAPLLRRGDLRDSFSHQVISEHEGVVGSTDPVAIFHEFGTAKMPPRPVLGPAAVRNRDKIRAIIGRAVVEGIIGGELQAGGGDYFGGDVGG